MPKFEDLLEQEELKNHLKNLIPAQKSVFEYEVYDFEGTEKGFAEDLDATRP